MFPGGRTEIHRRAKDERWSTKDKLEQYRGILKIHAREQKLRSRDAVRLKRQISWRLCSFREDVKRYSRIVNDAANGFAKSRTHALLQTRRDLRFKCGGRQTEEIYTTVYEETHRKRRQLDKLRYEKKTKMKRCFELQLEHAELYDEYVQEQKVPWARCGVQQQLVAHYQESIAKQNAAKAINLTYSYMLGILKKDAVHHDTLLNALKQDQKSQCEVILASTVIGQLAVEESDDIAERCKRITRNLWKNLKEREQALTFAREQVEDLWSYAQSLIRTESEAIFSREVTHGATSSHAMFNKQIRSLEEVFDKVKESMLVRSYRELLSRLEEQMKQRTRLLEQFDRNVKERESLLNKKNDALSSLSDVERTLVAIVEDYNADKNVLLEQIAIQKKRQFEYKNSRKDRGKLLMDIRAALQSMVAMLVCVRRGGKLIKKQTRDTDKKITTTKEEDEMDEQEDHISRIDIPMITVDTEGLALLSTVSRKVGALFGMSNFEFDKDREQRARDLYQTYVSNYRSKFRFTDVEIEPTGLFVEHEAIDASVPTRADIKLKSKQAVEAYLRLD